MGTDVFIYGIKPFFQTDKDSDKSLSRFRQYFIKL